MSPQSEFNKELLSQCTDPVKVLDQEALGKIKHQFEALSPANSNGEIFKSLTDVDDVSAAVKALARRIENDGVDVSVLDFVELIEASQFDVATMGNALARYNAQRGQGDFKIPEMKASIADEIKEEAKAAADAAKWNPQI